jgi:hypothetical protein
MPPQAILKTLFSVECPNASCDVIALDGMKLNIEDKCMADRLLGKQYEIYPCLPTRSRKLLITVERYSLHQEIAPEESERSACPNAGGGWTYGLIYLGIVAAYQVGSFLPARTQTSLFHLLV